MSSEQFTAILPYICANLVETIAQLDCIDPNAALARLYQSKLYSLLEDEDTKLWQYSTPMLYSLYEEEQKTGKITFPDV